MIRCCYVGYNDIYDAGLGDLFQSEMWKLLRLDSEMEFWYFRKDAVVNYILKWTESIRNDSAELKVQFVQVKDPSAVYDGLWERKSRRVSRSHCMCDRVEYGPDFSEYSGKCVSPAAKGNMIERWMLQQCDYIFMYIYSILPLYKAQRTYVRKLNAVTVSLEFDDTTNNIQKQIDLLDDRSQYIMKSLYQGISAAVVGKVLGISGSAVQQKSHEIAYKILRNMKCQCMEQ